MKPPRAKKQWWRGRTVQIAAVDTAKHEKRMHDAIARRAFVIFESRGGSVPGDPVGDWGRAESEVVQPLCCGFFIDDNKISVETDASAFEEGVIEICVAPRRLTICGRRRARTESSQSEIHRSGPPQEAVFYVLELPAAIDPSKAMTRFNGRVLIIDLPLQEQARMQPQSRDAKDLSSSLQA